MRCARTEQLVIFCHVSGFTSDFLSFVVVERLQFFRGALQFCFSKPESVDVRSVAYFLSMVLFICLDFHSAVRTHAVVTENPVP